MERVLFDNPALPEVGQPFTTVRRGDKWAGRVKAGDQVELAETEGLVLAFGEVLGAATCKFKELTQAVLDLEHDPACRTRTGLLAVLRGTYEGFADTEVVTVLTIKLLATVEDKPEPEPEGAVAAEEYAEGLGLNYGTPDDSAEKAEEAELERLRQEAEAEQKAPPRDATEAARRAVEAATAILDGYFGRKGRKAARPRAIAYQQVGKRILDLATRITS